MFLAAMEKATKAMPTANGMQVTMRPRTGLVGKN
jgi:hypothetical protein